MMAAPRCNTAGAVLQSCYKAIYPVDAMTASEREEMLSSVSNGEAKERKVENREDRSMTLIITQIRFVVKSRRVRKT